MGKFIVYTVCNIWTNPPVSFMCLNLCYYKYVLRCNITMELKGVNMIFDADHEWQKNGLLVGLLFDLKKTWKKKAFKKERSLVQDLLQVLFILTGFPVPCY